MLHDPAARVRAERLAATTDPRSDAVRDAVAGPVDERRGGDTDAVGGEALLDRIETPDEVAADDQPDAEAEREGEDASHVGPVGGRWSLAVVGGRWRSWVVVGGRSVAIGRQRSRSGG
jgi:hypothetical protein